MKNVYLALLFFITFSCLAQNQKLEIDFKDEIGFNADNYIGNDGLGYNYFIKNAVFIKKSSTETFEYKNLSLGTIQHVDIMNPLKIVLFYENFNTIVTLDNQLNETYKVNFSLLETPIVAAAAGMESQNRFWIYNNLTQKIGLFDYLKNNYIDLTQSFEGNLKYYDSNFNEFHWIDDKLNWYSCTIFGKIKNLGTVPNFEKLQLIDSTSFLFLKENQIFYKNIITKALIEIKINDKSIKSFFYKDQILTIFTAKGITNYKIILP